jgi:hypothetical protein
MKMQENPLYENFRNKVLPFANEITTLFKDVVANGEYTWAPSCGVLPCVFENDDNDDNDVVTVEDQAIARMQVLEQQLNLQILD